MNLTIIFNSSKQAEQTWASGSSFLSFLHVHYMVHYLALVAGMADQLVEEEYIDMEITTNTTNFMSCTTKPSSPPQPAREFEFHMSSNNLHLSPSPADDLFFNGHLLPLQLLKATTNTTPFESCNISPVTSCFPSGELNPDDYFFECSKDLSVEEDSSFQTKTSSSSSSSNKSWSKKIKLIKKASKAYLKSLFTKSGCSDTKECTSGNLKSTKKSPFGQIQKAASFIKRAEGEKKKKVVAEECGHRRSFSGAIKRRASGSVSSSSSSTSSCSSSNSSSFSSVNSNGPCQILKRSSSVNSDNECSIQGAIAYCKKTQQQQVKGRKSVSDVEFYLMTESRVDV